MLKLIGDKTSSWLGRSQEPILGSGYIKSFLKLLFTRNLNVSKKEKIKKCGCPIEMGFPGIDWPAGN